MFYTRTTLAPIPIAFSISFLFFLFLPFSPLISQCFDNASFESSSSCDPSDCNETGTSCVEDWWEYFPTSTAQSLWTNYACESLTSCDEDRGWQAFDGDSGPTAAATFNPFFMQGINKVVKVEFEFQANNEEANSGVYVYIAGSDTDVNTNSLELLASAGPFFNTSGCNTIELLLGSSSQGNNIVDFEYLVVGVDNSNPTPSPPGTSSADNVSGIIDNFFGCCEAISINIDDESCSVDQLCVEIEVDESCLPYDCKNDPNLSCSMVVDIESEENTFLTVESTKVCLNNPPLGDNDIFVAVTIEDNNQTYIQEIETFTYDYSESPCIDLDITTNTTWNFSNPPPNNGIFNVLSVKNGAQLIIENGINLKFCSQGKLLIEPGSRVLNYANLDAFCDDGWVGVEVKGNPNLDQSFILNQGYFFSGKRSVISNAQVGVKGYSGSGYQNSGGIIRLVEAFLSNNRIGVQLGNYLFENPITGQIKPYSATIEETTFTVDDNYFLSQPFASHIYLKEVTGISIKECELINTMSFSNASEIWEYGRGLLSINAGFFLRGDANSSSANSEITGFGQGVFVAFFRNQRPVTIENYDFSRNFVGVQGLFASGIKIKSNNFNLVNVPDENVSNVTSGITLSNGFAGMLVQENKFKKWFNFSKDISWNSML